MPETMQPTMTFARLSGIILAAGLSRRAAPHNKLLLPARSGSAVVRCVALAFCEAGLGEVVVVTGHQREQIEGAVSGLPIRVVFAPDYALGMGHSLAAGIRASAPGSSGFLVSPGDLPGMHAGLVREIAQAFGASNGFKNIVPTCGGQPGHPVALIAELRPKLEALVGDRGAKVLLATADEAARTRYLAVADRAICADNDRGKVD